MFLRYRKYWFGFYLLPIFPEDNKNIFLDLFEAIFILIIFFKGFWGFENSSIQISFEFKHDAATKLVQGQGKARDVTTHPH